MSKIWLLIVLLCCVLFGFLGLKKDENKEISTEDNSQNLLITDSLEHNIAVTESDKVARDELLLGCNNQDCIPAISKPIFDIGSETDWLDEDDLVFGIAQSNVVRAYPAKILNRHEIVNETIEGVPVAITFCPLCGSAIAFIREVNGVETDFGVSGLLYNDNLVMYDRSGNSSSYWQQATGEAIIGPATTRNETLERFPIATMTWREWLENNPETKVLSRDNGFGVNYDFDPYAAYPENDEIWFGTEFTDIRLPIKAEIFGFIVDGHAKAYQSDDIPDEGLRDVVAGKEVIVRRRSDGAIVMYDDATNEYAPLRTFWFAWAAFYPETELYSK